jgi:threonine aldolase
MTAGQLADKARRRGLAISTSGKYRVRACTHLDVSAADIETALAILRDVLA